MRSIYRWRGQMERSDERQVVIKTQRDRVPALEQALRGAHPYDVPEFLVLPVETGSADYMSWLLGETDSST
jgi:periplasmic divalent cation tolerance protein